MIGCAESTGESRDLRVATRKFTLSDDNREKEFREKEKTSIILGVVVSSFRRERERERKRERLGKRKLDG